MFPIPTFTLAQQIRIWKHAFAEVIEHSTFRATPCVKMCGPTQPTNFAWEKYGKHTTCALSYVISAHMTILLLVQLWLH